jgi:sialate O-acetylesterase
MKIPHLWLAGALCAFLPAAANATVKMPAIFGDHMVLQQGLKLHVWGTADRDESVSVWIDGHEAKTVAGSEGKWEVNLDPLKVTGQPVRMRVTGVSNQIEFQDILVGDVWVCSGQSNMEFGITNASNASEAIAGANQPEIRLFLLQRKTSLKPLEDCIGKWVLCTPESIVQGGWFGFTALGYFFGKEIHDGLHIPVGLIETSWGGTPAEAWTDVDAFKTDPALKFFYDTVQAIGILAGKPGSPDFESNPTTPSVLYNGMINPLIKLPIKGVIWYQGESNGSTVESSKQYGVLFPAMISGWRKKWELGDFPFLFVQLAGFAPGTQYPILRDSQTSTLRLPKTGMAVAFDIGNETDIHPKDKVDLGHRLALAALHVAYGEDNVYSGPTYAGMQVQDTEVRVSFNHRGGGLVIGASPLPGPAGAGSAKPADHLEGFELAGADGQFAPAAARIDGDTVVLTAPGVTAPTAVRYGWKGFMEVNLYNVEGLPAVPFNSQTTPVIP